MVITQKVVWINGSKGYYSKWMRHWIDFGIEALSPRYRLAKSLFGEISDKNERSEFHRDEKKLKKISRGEFY